VNQVRGQAKEQPISRWPFAGQVEVKVRASAKDELGAQRTTVSRRDPLGQIQAQTDALLGSCRDEASNK
jgi:hypothetical protein